MTPFMVKIANYTKTGIVFPKWERLFSNGKNRSVFSCCDLNNPLYLPKKICGKKKTKAFLRKTED